MRWPMDSASERVPSSRSASPVGVLPDDLRLGPVGTGDNGHGLHPVTVHHGKGAHRDLATTTDPAQKGPFRSGRHPRVLMDQGGYQLPDPVVFLATFHHHHPLPSGGNELGWRQQAGDPVAQTQSPQSGRGQDDGVEPLGQLPEPGVHVTPQGHDVQVRSGGQQLCLASKARRPHPGRFRQIVEACVSFGHEGVVRDIPLQLGAQDQPVGQQVRNILHAVDGDVTAFVNQ